MKKIYIVLVAALICSDIALASKDFYQILGVSRTATLQEIKSAYRKQAMEWHPDRNPNKPDAEERFKEISIAYAALSDPSARRKHDPDDSSVTDGIAEEVRNYVSDKPEITNDIIFEIIDFIRSRLKLNSSAGPSNADEKFAIQRLYRLLTEYVFSSHYYAHESEALAKACMAILYDFESSQYLAETREFIMSEWALRSDALAEDLLEFTSHIVKTGELPPDRKTLRQRARAEATAPHTQTAYCEAWLEMPGQPRQRVVIPVSISIQVGPPTRGRR